MIIPNFKNSREYILDITQEELAKELKKARSTIACWEKGHDTIPLEELINYANTYNFSIDYLLGLDNKVYNYEKIIFNRKQLSENLRKLRKLNEYKEESIASLIGTGQSNYSHYETNRNVITTTYLYSLTKYYKKFSVDKILGRKQKNTNKKKII